MRPTRPSEYRQREIELEDQKPLTTRCLICGVKIEYLSTRCRSCENQRRRDESPPVIERLLNKVVFQEDGCWFYSGGTARGYGKIGSGGGKGRQLTAHIVTYEYFRENVPEGLQLDHLCRVTQCVNPWHLEAVTPRENYLRSSNRNAKRHLANRCKYGHSLEDSYIRPNGTRACRACRRRREKEARVRATASHL